MTADSGRVAAWGEWSGARFGCADAPPDVAGARFALKSGHGLCIISVVVLRKRLPKGRLSTISEKKKEMLRIAEWSAARPQSKVVERFLERSAFPEEAEKAAAEVLAAIRAEGDRAVARYVEKFEGAKLSPKRFRVADAELAAAEAQVPTALKRAVKDAWRRVARFSRASMRAPW